MVNIYATYIVKIEKTLYLYCFGELASSGGNSDGSNRFVSRIYKFFMLCLYYIMSADGIHESGGAEFHRSPPEKIPRNSFLVSPCR